MAKEVFSVMVVNSIVIEHCNEMLPVVLVHESDDDESAMVRNINVDCNVREEEVVEDVTSYYQTDESVAEDYDHY